MVKGRARGGNGQRVSSTVYIFLMHSGGFFIEFAYFAPNFMSLVGKGNNCLVVWYLN